MRIGLYEPSLGGHHGSYTLAIAREAATRGWRVSLFVPRRDTKHELINRLAATIGQENILFSDYWVEKPVHFTRSSLIRYHAAQRWAAMKSLKSVERQFDFVYASNIDYMDKAIQAFGSPSFPTPFGGMCMRVRFHMKALGIDCGSSQAGSLLDRLTFRRLLVARGVACITTADPSLSEFCLGQASRRFRKVRYVPEIGMGPPSFRKPDAKAQLGFSPDDCVILVYGVLSGRKAIGELLHAIETQGDHTSLRALIAGHPDPETQQLLRERSPPERRRFTTVFGFADSRTEKLIFAAADAVWVAYKDHATMSGVFYQGICSHIPVITADYGILKWLGEKQDVGINVDPNNAVETGAKLTKLFHARTEYDRFCSNAMRIAAQHRPAEFGSKTCDVIQEAFTCKKP
jgi:glycosyltransferase involved in cell wall biosynthesis